MVEKKFLNFFISVAIITIVADQLSKYLIYLYQPSLDLKILELTFIKNTGAGFGLLQDQTLFLSLISAIVAGIIIFSYPKIPLQKWPQFLLALFLGGVLGNFIDRLFRGYVIDFINFKIWPAFNLADASITIAAIGLIIYFWKEEK